MTDLSTLTVGGVKVPGEGIPVTSGKTFFVDFTLGSDGNNGESMEQPLKTCAQANTLTRTNKDDVVVLMGNSTHTLTAMLTISKNRVHWVGLDAGIGRRYGQNAKVSLGVTTAAADIATLQVTGVRNTFTNIKFLNSNTVTEGIYCVADGGEYTRFYGCEMFKSTDLDVTGAADLVCNGDSSHYERCYIGTTVSAISGAIIRPCVTFSRGLAASGKVARDVTFESCIFARKFGNTANRFLFGEEANAIERLCYVKECIFWGAKLSTAIPAQNVGFTNTQTDGDMLLHNCSSIRAATAMSTTTGVFVDSPVPTAATSGISVQAA